MAFSFIVNKTPANHVGSMMYLWQTMVSAGWLVLSYSDGLQTAASGSPGAGFLGFYTASDGTPFHTAGISGSANNSRAWILLTQPIHPSGTAYPYSGSRQFVFQKDTSTTRSWRCKYSSTGCFWPATGSSSASTLVVPGANTANNDEVIFVGGGTDSVPTFATFFQNASEGALRTNCAADDGISGSVAPYGIYMLCEPAGGGNVNTAFILDPMTPGSTPSADIDPFIIYNGNVVNTVLYTNTDTFTASNGTAANNPRGWLRRGQSDQTFTQIGACYFYNSVSAVGQVRLSPNGIGGNSANAFDDLCPLMYARQPSTGGLTGYKGISGLFRWNGNTHLAGETMSITDPGTSRDRICFDDINLPWDGTTVPLI